VKSLSICEDLKTISEILKQIFQDYEVMIAEAEKSKMLD
jgi:hypothetical protein